MDSIIALLSLILQITSTICRGIDFKEPELGLNTDNVISNIAEHLLLPEPNQVRDNQLKKLKRLLKVIPFKGNKKWKNNNTNLRRELENKDVPIAVIVAANLKDINKNLVESLNKVNNLDDTVNVNEKTDNPIIATDKIEDLFTDENKLVNPKNEAKTNLNETIDNVETSTIKIEPKKRLQDLLKPVEKLKETDVENDNKDTDANRDLAISDIDLPESELDIFFKDLDGTERKVDEILPIDKHVEGIDSSMSISDSDEEEVVGESKINEKYVENSNDTKTFQYQKYLICKEFNLTEEGFNHKHYYLNFVFN